MAYYEFISLCYQYTVSPELALENDSLRKAIRSKKYSEVERILREEF